MFSACGIVIDCFADMVAILISIVSNSYITFPVLWDALGANIHLPPEHPIMSFKTIEVNMVTLSAKWFIDNSRSETGAETQQRISQ